MEKLGFVSRALSTKGKKGFANKRKLLQQHCIEKSNNNNEK